MHHHTQKGRHGLDLMAVVIFFSVFVADFRFLTWWVL
jgi:hypothetical protein